MKFARRRRSRAAKFTSLPLLSPQYAAFTWEKADESEFPLVPGSTTVVAPSSEAADVAAALAAAAGGKEGEPSDAIKAGTG